MKILDETLMLIDQHLTNWTVIFIWVMDTIQYRYLNDSRHVIGLLCNNTLIWNSNINYFFYQGHFQKIMKNLKPKKKKQIHAYNTKVKSQQKMKYRKDKCCKTDYDHSLFQIWHLNKQINCHNFNSSTN